MAKISFSCPKCGARLGADAARAGAPGECPKCHAKLSAPDRWEFRNSDDRVGLWVQKFGCGSVLLLLAAIAFLSEIQAGREISDFSAAFGLAGLAGIAITIGKLSRIADLLEDVRDGAARRDKHPPAPPDAP